MNSMKDLSKLFELTPLNFVPWWTKHLNKFNMLPGFHEWLVPSKTFFCWSGGWLRNSSWADDPLLFHTKHDLTWDFSSFVQFVSHWCRNFASLLYHQPTERPFAPRKRSRQQFERCVRLYVNPVVNAQLYFSCVGVQSRKAIEEKYRLVSVNDLETHDPVRSYTR